eukprot:TRINITY_DN7429_c0_g1_i1.p1 TRINITY_DN7429_c0_g1~~TRINITY_DN7429_c0_g1_i1.p1  ORF type:complete len:344 (-),score=61.76 TRINITY_DN7429_c0_g1_i1:139-1128(-)
MSNKVFIRTDKGHYIEGDVVSGQICLSLSTPIDAKSIVLKVTGFEETKWKEQHTRSVPVAEGEPPKLETYVEEYGAKKDFFREKIVIFHAQTQIPPGNWAYPFSYQLPKQLPGVFHESGHGSFGCLEYKARIEYKVKALVDVSGFFSKDLKATDKLIVHERLDTAVAPVHMQEKRDVMFCCCVKKGECTLKAWFDANAYVPGQTVQITAEADNQSTVNVDNLVVILYRSVEIRDKSGHRRYRVDNIAERRYEGVKPMSKETRVTPLQVPGSAAPATKSSLIECKYWVNVECDIPWCPDVEIHLPAVIYAPQPQQWGTPGYGQIQFQPYH